ncbi:MAG: hypothetical protein SNJ72_10150 [Fimbriimonadales bacterium]
MSKVVELFGHATESPQADWSRIVHQQECPFLSKRCYKVRKSDPNTSIGTCTILSGRAQDAVVICPARLLERNQIFIDCIPLLSTHHPDNELHIVREVSIPGGTIDFMLASVRSGKVVDFVGIEVQALDTTGTLWPHRQQLLLELGVLPEDELKVSSLKSYGINWKMTAKTTLVQLHHKIRTFEHLHKRLVLVLQDVLFNYMKDEFSFNHFSNPAELSDAMHLHVYQMAKQPNRSLSLNISQRLSTNAEGLLKSLDLRGEPYLEISTLTAKLEAKLTSGTLLKQT